MESLTLIVPFYRQPKMLAVQIQEWERYPRREWIRFVVVDDGSPEPASVPEWVTLYRIHEDIPWNRGGARNLGAHVAETEWIVHTDLDHVLPAAAAEALLAFQPDSSHWYRFSRERIGRADETRRKDELPADCERGPIRPHIDSYLCRRQLYWQVGGYHEGYSGCLGGGSAFLRHLTRAGGEPKLLPAPIELHVHTRHSVPDASVTTLPRTRDEYERRNAHLSRQRAVNPLRFRWSKTN